MFWVREQTIPTELPPLVGEVIANFCGPYKTKFHSISKQFSWLKHPVSNVLDNDHHDRFTKQPS
jgi:hypothetical protein